MPPAEINESTERIPVGRVTILRRGKKGIWTAEYHQHGRHCRRSLRTTNQKAAQQRARDLNAELIDGSLPDPYTAAPISIGEAIEQFLAAKGVDGRSSKTLAKYRTELNRLARYASSHRVHNIQDITAPLYDRYRADRSRQIDTYTAYNHGMILITFLKWCRIRRLVRDSPLEGYQLPKPRRRHHMTPTLAQVNALLAAADEPLRTILATLAFTGMRVGELRQLRPQDLDLEEGWIRIASREDWKTKTGVSRKVPIHPRLRKYLAALPKTRRSLVFTGATGKPAEPRPIDEGKLNDVAKRVARSLGMPVGRQVCGFVTHSLRHFFLSHTLNARVPKYAVDAWVGHTGDQSVGRMYYGFTDDESQRLMNSVPFDETVLPNGTTNKKEDTDDIQ